MYNFAKRSDVDPTRDQTVKKNKQNEIYEDNFTVLENIERDELIQIFISRLSDRGITITPDQFLSVTQPLSCIYAIPDHLHALANMLGDGLVPSNAKSGYLASKASASVVLFC